MNTRTKILFRKSDSIRIIAAISGTFLALSLFAADRDGARFGGDGRRGGGDGARFGNSAPRAFTPAPRSGFVDRSIHGSIRHAETHAVPFRVEPERHFEGRRFEEHRDFRPRGDVFFHHDLGRRFFWHDFAFHRHIAALPLGFLSLHIGGAPYFYYDGIYYQQAPDGYEEVYPPVGAAVPQPPEGSVPIEAGGQTYYYAGGAFYVQQPDGSFAIAPTPIGVIVPELPPGAVEVSVTGEVAYQFNGIYYRPVFADGVTQYETFRP